MICILQMQLIILRRMKVLTTLALIALSTPALAIEKCSGGHRHTCVVDGDTLWMEGVKYRPAGYDTPEPQTNICGGRREVALAHKATKRFIQLLNTTKITIEALGRHDKYDRDLIKIYSDGRDIGDILVSEGLARYWPDGEEFWCR